MLRRDYRAEIVVVLERRLGEVGLDNLTGDVDRMVLLQVQFSRGRIQYVGRDIEPRLVCGVSLPPDGYSSVLGFNRGFCGGRRL